MHTAILWNSTFIIENHDVKGGYVHFFVTVLRYEGRSFIPCTIAPSFHMAVIKSWELWEFQGWGGGQWFWTMKPNFVWIRSLFHKLLKVQTCSIILIWTLYVFVWFDSLSPSQQVYIMSGWVFLCWTSTKQGLLCLKTTQWRRQAETHNASVSSQALYHWATALRRTLFLNWCYSTRTPNALIGLRLSTVRSAHFLSAFWKD